MRCFARWKKDDDSEIFFRDQTTLQFGSGWDLRSSFVLLNPGSAHPTYTFKYGNSTNIGDVGKRG